MLRKFIRLNQLVCKRVDSLIIPKAWRVDGLKDYVKNIAPTLLHENSRICDVGGGKRPFVGTETPKTNKMHLTGIDIDAHELEAAPSGVYDKKLVLDIGSNTEELSYIKATVVLCEAVLEHVQDTEQAIRNIAELTSKDGQVALFIPSRYALFAVINRILPESIKQKLLFSIFPGSEHAQGFPAYYSNCVPSTITGLLESNGIEVKRIVHYFESNYFSFFIPAHIVWRMYQVVSYALIGHNAAESFSIVGVKK